MTPDIRTNEANFLGCLLRSPHEFWAINDKVGPEMFTESHHREIYTAVRFLAESGRQVTFPALQASLPEDFEERGPTIALLQVLRANAEDAGSATDYVENITAQSGQRKLAALAKWLDKESKNRDRNAEEVAAELAMHAHEIMAIASPIKPQKLSDITEKVVSFSNSARDKEILPGFTTGLIGLDEMIGLIMGGDFIAVMASIGEGKSSVLTGIADHIAKSVPVLGAHNEMSAEQNGTRAVAAESGLSIREIREGAYDFQGAELVHEAQIRLRKSNLYIYPDPKMTIRSIRARALQMKRTVGLGAILVDGLKRLRIDGKFYDAWDRKEAITGALKEMAIELNVPVIAACQRTRKGRRNEDPTPHLDDAQFPSLEEDADTIIGVWREEAYLMMNRPNSKAGAEAMEEWEHKIRRAKGVGKMIGLKVRSNTPFQQREFKWDGPRTRFADL